MSIIPEMGISIIFSIIGAIVGSFFTLLIASFIYRVNYESRLKDLEKEIETLNPIICVIRNCGIKRAEKRFEELVEQTKEEE